MYISSGLKGVGIKQTNQQGVGESGGERLKNTVVSTFSPPGTNEVASFFSAHPRAHQTQRMRPKAGFLDRYSL